MIRVAILGATGYTAYELIRLLLRHPQVQVTVVTSRSETSHIAQVHPALYGRLDLKLENPSTQKTLAAQADVCLSTYPRVPQYGDRAEAVVGRAESH